MSQFTEKELRSLETLAGVLLGTGGLFWLVAALGRATGIGVLDYLVCMVGAAGTLAVVAVVLRLLVWAKALWQRAAAAADARRLVVFLAVFDAATVLALGWLFFEAASMPDIALCWPQDHPLAAGAWFLVAAALPWAVYSVVRIVFARTHKEGSL